jgi:hypothetical protein
MPRVAADNLFSMPVRATRDFPFSLRPA